MRAFAATVRTGSFAAAAEELRLTAGAVSHHVARLEDIVGARLFELLKSAADELRSAGVEVGTVLDLAGQVRIVDVFDPDGNRIQLAQHFD